MSESLEIWNLARLEAEIGAWPWMETGMTRVFREAAARWPDDPEAQAAFHELWLGGYLRHDRELAYVALDGAPVCQVAEVVGYLVASQANQATDPRFASLGYLKDFAPQFPQYPVHLHMNIDARFRNQGLGRKLITALAADLRAMSVPGVHIVTSRAQRNVGFYHAAGFQIVAGTFWKDRDLVMMGLRI